jgi:serine/threonine protein kinase/predicted membrane-bound spermidine synthase
MVSAAHNSVVRIGQILDQRYRVERLIGEGSMGFVFAARDIDSGQVVALKLLRPHLLAESVANERFHREIKATMSLDCEHIVRTLDVGHLGSGDPFMVMEYLEGVDLSKVIRDSGALAIERAVDYALQTCMALAHAHKQGFIHRDIKPANLMLVQSVAERELIKVLDFGISKLKPRASATLPLNLTANAVRLGSPLYVSPEQKASAAAADERSDIWSLGVTLFEMIAGVAPFVESPESLRDRNEPPIDAPRVSRYRSGVPRQLEQVLARCLQRVPRRRFQTVAELASALEPFASVSCAGLGRDIAELFGTSSPVYASAAFTSSTFRSSTSVSPAVDVEVNPHSAVAPSTRRSPETLPSIPGEVVRPDWRWFLLFGAAGAMALGVQTYLLRDFIVLLQGDEVAVGVGLAAWFVGISVGAWAVRHCSAGMSRRVAASALSLLGPLGCAALLVGRLGRGLMGVAPSEPMTLGPALVLAICLFTLPSICVGGAFVALAVAANAELGNARAAIGRLYVFEAIGSLTAGLLTSVGLALCLPAIEGLGLLIGFALLCAVPAAYRGMIAGKRSVPLIALSVFGLVMSPAGAWLEQRTEVARFSALAPGSPLVAAKNTPYQKLAIGGTEPRVLYANGQYLASFPDPTSDEPIAHELMLFAARPSRVLSLGGIETGLLRFCLLHPVQSIDLVLVDSDALRFLEPYLAAPERTALADPRVHVIFDDSRRFLARGGAAYDLVLSLEPDPTTLLLARNTSLEFYRIVRSRLSANGVYVTRFSAGANVQANDVGMLGASLHRTLREVFPAVRATPGPEAFFVAGNASAGITVDAAVLEQRYRERQIPSEAFLAELLPELLPRERVAAINAELERAEHSAEVARDDRPIAFLHALSMRQRIAGSAWARVLDWSTHHSQLLAVFVFVPSLAILAYTCLRRRARRPCLAEVFHAVAVTGATGLASSLLCFVSFQTRVGALYSELGMLSGVFMAGLALGGVLGMRIASRRPLLFAQLASLALAVAMVIALGCFDRLAPFRTLVWLLHVLLLASAGFGTGMVFPAAVRELLSANVTVVKDGAGRVAMHLELWDHAGAAVAALLFSVLVFPTFGLVRSSCLLVALQLLACLLTWFR